MKIPVLRQARTRTDQRESQSGILRHAGTARMARRGSQLLQDLITSASWRIATKVRLGLRTLPSPLQRHLRRGIRMLRGMAALFLPRSPGVPLFDDEWYLSQYPDVAAAGKDPWTHFIVTGASEGRYPNPLFDSAWYTEIHPDVRKGGQNPLLHYIAFGAAELRPPHPHFDPEFYVDRHPDAARNPLEHYLRHGRHLGWSTRAPFIISEYLPANASSKSYVDLDVKVDVVVPVYRGAEETRRCIESILSDPYRAYNRLIVIDDCSPETELICWLHDLAKEGTLELLSNASNLGFVRSVNRGIAHSSPDSDVLLINSDTEVPSGWLKRLILQARKHDMIGTVTPLSNNATICSYPSNAGGPLPHGFSLRNLDRAAQDANAGRSIEVPTAVGFCMYIRRDCLNDVGAFDAETFGRGYGEENDFCLRASKKGWKHLLACDTFVFHAGEVSFGPESMERQQAWRILVTRYPNYPDLIGAFVRRRSSTPYLFALTSALYRESQKPKILIVTHNLGGGTERHVQDLMRGTDAHFLVLRPRHDGVELSVPGIGEHPSLNIHQQDIQELVPLLNAFGVSRLHIHHVLGFDADIHSLVRNLALPFDFSVHDYFGICPQINLLGDDDRYCGEPDLAGCNSCLRKKPSLAARDILSWRKVYEWLFIEADRVICPSGDVRQRLDRYGLADRAIVAPHEPNTAESWPIFIPAAPVGSEPLKIAVLGVLAPNKGAATFIECVRSSRGRNIKFFLIGTAQPPLPKQTSRFVSETGAYKDENLPELIREMDPHVIWFPAPWPETYSYTLSAAIASGRPIVASRIGSFPERLKGRPWTWLHDINSSVESWCEVFRRVRVDLESGRWSGSFAPRKVSNSDFYKNAYLAPGPASRISNGLLDARRAGRITALVIPEGFSGGWSPCAYIRLLQPLTHPTVAGELDVIVTSAKQAANYRADFVITHRTAVPDLDQLEALIRHCKSVNMKLVYDLDDDLLHISADHSSYAAISACHPAIKRLLAAADAVFVSTSQLQTRVRMWRPDAILMPNALDERIWKITAPLPSRRDQPVRVLYMGTQTHDADLAIFESAARDLRSELGSAVSFDVIGVSTQDRFTDWARRVLPPVGASSYPAFVDWITAQKHWDVGVAPLVENDFNQTKSAIKVLDYWALGAAVIASDMPVYREVLKNGENGLLVSNVEIDWHRALRALVLDPFLRQRIAASGRVTLAQSQTLNKCGPLWLKSIKSILNNSDSRRALM